MCQLGLLCVSGPEVTFTPIINTKYINKAAELEWAPKYTKSAFASKQHRNLPANKTYYGKKRRPINSQKFKKFHIKSMHYIHKSRRCVRTVYVLLIGYSACCTEIELGWRTA
jgi:hypothetical protein